MQKDVKQREEETLSAQIQDVMKSLITAIRIVKIYPPNNPIYSQSIKKAFDALTGYLDTSPAYHLGVQKTCFTYQQSPLGDAQVNRSIAQDLFAKGVREMIFSAGMTNGELRELFLTLALSPEELSMKSGISTILWEKGAIHIKVTEAGLDEVITTKTKGGWEAGAAPAEDAGAAEGKKRLTPGRTLVLGDLKTDPQGFGSGMVEFALRTRAAHETLEERLFTLYRQAGKKIQQDHAQESEVLFEGLAKSVLSLESPHRESLIAGKLYGDLDADTAQEAAEGDVQLPSVLHEIRTGRFADVWTVQQVSTLLKRSAEKKAVAPAAPPDPKEIQAVPVPEDLITIARGLDNDTPEYMDAVKAISEAGMESDIIDAAVRTLIALIPLVKNPYREGSKEREIQLFSGVVHQLEDILSYLLKNNNYELATNVIKALHTPVDPQFKPRMAEALKKTATKSIVKSTIADMRKYARDSVEYQAAYDYLSNLDRKATEVLLELLAEEKDREIRIFLLDLMKDFGKDQLILLGEHMSDDRWYVVRNIVSILAESRTDQALFLLRKAAEHKQVQIRHEVIKALIATGGKKAASVLAKFLKDKDEGIQLTALRAFAEMAGIGADEAQPLVDFLEERSENKKEQERILAAIETLGKTGGADAGLYLHRYTRIRWWRSRKLQAERRTAALRAIQEIARRADGGRTER
jgi:HEAT repeat protein